MQTWETWMSVTVAVVIPLVIWGYCVYQMIKKLLEMHESPDKYFFGTKKTNELILKSGREITTALTAHTHCLNELVHYTKWMAKISNDGQDPPPHVPEV